MLNSYFRMFVFAGVITGLGFATAYTIKFTKYIKQEKLKKQILEKSLKSDKPCALSLTELCP